MAETTTTTGLWGETIEVPVQTEETTDTTSETTSTDTTSQETSVDSSLEENTDTSTVLQETSTDQEFVVQEKIVEVEKIIEKYPEFKDEYSKSLYEKLLQGDEDELYSYLSEKKKNYEVMSDYDVVKENLKKSNPQWSAKDVEAEIKFKYGKEFDKIDISAIDREDEPEAYEKAVRHNDDVERRELILERDARDARIALEAQKKNIELPKISKEEAKPEVNQPTQEEIDELNRQWEAEVEAEVPKLSDITFKVENEEVVYKITDAEKREMAATMKDFEVGDYFSKRGWFNEDGQPNIKQITEDVYKLENMGKILSASASKIKTSTKKDVVAEIKNVDLTRNQSQADITTDIGAKIWS